MEQVLTPIVCVGEHGVSEHPAAPNELATPQQHDSEQQAPGLESEH